MSTTRWTGSAAGSTQWGVPETYAHDGTGNLVSTTDRKGQATTFTYDALNRRTRATYEDGSVATFTHDAAGRLVQADDTADPHRPILLAYDTLDRLLTETTGLGTVRYQYDALGWQTQMTVNDFSPVVYTYNAASRLRTITQAPLNQATIDHGVTSNYSKLHSSHTCTPLAGQDDPLAQGAKEPPATSF